MRASCAYVARQHGRAFARCNKKAKEANACISGRVVGGLSGARCKTRARKGKTKKGGAPPRSSPRKSVLCRLRAHIQSITLLWAAVGPRGLRDLRLVYASLTRLLVRVGSAPEGDQTITVGEASHTGVPRGWVGRPLVERPSKPICLEHRFDLRGQIGQQVALCLE